MSTSAAHLIRKWLIDQYHFSEAGDWSLYIVSLPDATGIADDVGAISDTPGIKDGRDMKTGEIFMHPGFQIRVRSKAYMDGWDKMQNISTALSTLKNQTIVLDNTTYKIQTVIQTGSIAPMGREEGSKRRFLFSLNFITVFEEV